MVKVRQIFEKTIPIGFKNSQSDFNIYWTAFLESELVHALEKLTGENEIPLDSQDISYTAFNKVKQIAEGNYELNFTYGLDRARKKTVLKENDTPILEKYFFGSYEIREDLQDGNTYEYHFLPGGAIYRIANGVGEMLYTYTDYLGSITHITDAAGNLIHEQSFDAWGRERDPDTYEYPAVQTGHALSLTNDRGYTGHEMLPQFGIINMNGRLYDPILGRMLSPDPYVQMPDYSQNFNRYAYVLNNPLKFTDPSGEFVHLIVGAVIGGYLGYIHGDMSGAEGLSLAGHIAVGAIAGAASGGVGAGVSSVLGGGSFGAGFVGTSSYAATTSFYSGFMIGASSGFTGGFINGTGTSLLHGNNFGDAVLDGTKQGFIGGVSSGITGGLGGGINAALDGRHFLHGGPKAKIYRSPIHNNHGKRNGECVLRCLEESSSSYGFDNFDFNYWYKENGSLGVHGDEVQNLINSSELFKSNPFFVNSYSNDLSQIELALSFDQRVIVGFQTPTGGEHAVMVRKLKVWPNGKYRIWFAETSPSRIAPFSTSRLYEVMSTTKYYTFEINYDYLFKNLSYNFF